MNSGQLASVRKHLSHSQGQDLTNSAIPQSLPGILSGSSFMSVDMAGVVEVGFEEMNMTTVMTWGDWGSDVTNLKCQYHMCVDKDGGVCNFEKGVSAGYGWHN